MPRRARRSRRRCGSRRRLLCATLPVGCGVRVRSLRPRGVVGGGGYHWARWTTRARRAQSLVILCRAPLCVAAWLVPLCQLPPASLLVRAALVVRVAVDLPAPVSVVRIVVRSTSAGTCVRVCILLRALLRARVVRLLIVNSALIVMWLCILNDNAHTTPTSPIRSPTSAGLAQIQNLLPDIIAPPVFEGPHAHHRTRLGRSQVELPPLGRIHTSYTHSWWHAGRTLLRSSFTCACTSLSIIAIHHRRRIQVRTVQSRSPRSKSMTCATHARTHTRTPRMQRNTAVEAPPLAATGWSGARRGVRDCARVARRCHPLATGARQQHVVFEALIKLRV